MLESRPHDPNQPVKLQPFSPVEASACTIMVVSQCAGSARSLCALLTDYGYDAFEVAGPQEALAQLFTAPENTGSLLTRPDLILFEMKGDSLESLAFLQDIHRFKVPVMLITSIEGNPFFEKAVIELEAADFIVEPVRPSELLMRIHLLLHNFSPVLAARNKALLSG